MKLTIFNVYVPMADQAQCDRMKQLCIDNGLPFWDDNCAFVFNENTKFSFGCLDLKKHNDSDFFLSIGHSFKDYKKVTEQQFIELLKERQLNN